MTIDRPDGRELKRLTDALMKREFAGNSKDLIGIAASISERSTLKNADVDAAYSEQIASFYGRLTEIHAGDALKQRFARDIRGGAMDDGERAAFAYDVLKAHARARLDISNPEYKGG